MEARQLIYSGRVQGVGFRWMVRHLATGFDVNGFVRNLPDGTVELWLQGEPEEMDEMEKAIQESHLGSFIRDVVKENDSPDPKTKGFNIR